MGLERDKVEQVGAREGPARAKHCRQHRRGDDMS